MSARSGHRRSIRVPEYDYASAGAYFVTICVQNRACVLGDVVEAGTVLSTAGQMVESWWNTIGGRCPAVAIDAYVIMPNHIHGLLRFGWGLDAETGGHESDERGHESNEGRHGGLPLRTTGADTDRRGKPPCLPLLGDRDAAVQPAPPVTLGRVIQWFKSATTMDYGVGVDRYGWPPYPGRFWQRNYFERIVRDEIELDRIRAYIAGNPGRWAEDEENRDAPTGFV